MSIDNVKSSKSSSERSASAPKKVESKAAPKTTSRTDSAPAAATNKATASYNRDSFESASTKAPVAGIGATASASASTAAAPAAASTPAEQAQALIEKHTNLGGLNLDEKGLGQELAQMAAADPAANGPVIDEVFKQLGSSLLGGDNKEQVAKEMAKSLTDDQLNALGGTHEGQAVLENVKAQIERNGVSRSEQAQFDRVSGTLERYAEPTSVEEIKAGLEAGRTDDVFRDGVAKFFGSCSPEQAHEAMESIRADGLQRKLIDAVMRDKDGNPSDVRLRDGVEAMLNTGRVDFMVQQIASKSYNVFSGSINGSSDNHYYPSGDANEGVYITVDRANDAAELPRTLVHETFHAYARDHGSTYGAAEEGVGIALIHYAFTDGQYNVAECIYGTKNWYRDSGSSIDMGNFENADPALRAVLDAVSSRDESQVALQDPAQMQSDYDNFWAPNNRFDGTWESKVPYMTQAMVYEHERARLEADGLSPDEIVNRIGEPPKPPTTP